MKKTIERNFVCSTIIFVMNLPVRKMITRNRTKEILKQNNRVSLAWKHYRMHGIQSICYLCGHIQFLILPSFFNHQHHYSRHPYTNDTYPCYSEMSSFVQLFENIAWWTTKLLWRLTLSNKLPLFWFADFVRKNIRKIMENKISLKLEKYVEMSQSLWILWKIHLKSLSWCSLKVSSI